MPVDEGYRMPGTVARVLDRALAAAPDREALVTRSQRLTYAELDRLADRAAHAFVALGVGPGDRVAVSLPNDTDLPVLDTRSWRATLDAAGGMPIGVDVDPHAPAAIAYTSGTTGRPKGAVHSQYTLLLPGAVLVETRGYGSGLRKGDCFALTIRAWWRSTSGQAPATFPVRRAEPSPTWPCASPARTVRPSPAGALGEICVGAADHPYRTMLGYWERPEAGPDTLAGGELHTGDIGYLDDDGLLHVCDRKSLLIIRGGANVYPAEIERVLVEHPAVGAAAVFGVPDERFGERVAAVVQPTAGITVDVEDVRALLSANLARYEVPGQIAVVTALPRNAMGKIVRTELPGLLA
jgi:acyl-CoA synthetase (AMP-forming)/AMP-acid ligase II